MLKLVSKYTPSGDQPQAIDKLVDGIKNGVKEQALLGATGTGKTFTMANVIAEVNKSTIILFPENHVEYFVSYYSYSQNKILFSII